MRLSPRDADVKGVIFRHTIYPPSLVVIAFIFSELRRESPPCVVEDEKKPGLNRVKGALSRIISIFLNSQNIYLCHRKPTNNSLFLLTIAVLVSWKC